MRCFSISLSPSNDDGMGDREVNKNRSESLLAVLLASY